MDFEQLSKNEKFTTMDQMFLYQHYFQVYCTLVELEDISVKGQTFKEFIQESLNQTKVLEEKTNSKITFYSNTKLLLHAARVGEIGTLVLDQSFLPLVMSEVQVTALSLYQSIFLQKETLPTLDELKRRKRLEKLAVFGPFLYLFNNTFKFCYDPSIALFASSMNVLFEFGRFLCSKKLFRLSENLKLYKEQERVLTAVKDFSSIMNPETEKEYTKKKI